MSGEHSHSEHDDLAEQVETLTGSVSGLVTLNQRLADRVTALEGGPDPDPDPDPDPPPPTDEPYPDNAFLVEPGDDVRAAALQHRVVELADGHYGNQQLAGGLDGAYIFSRTGNAIFDGEHAHEGFQWGANNATFRNFHARRYRKIGDSQAAVEARGVKGCRYIDMQVGLVRGGAGVRIVDQNEWIGGRLYDCHQFGYTGSGNGGIIRGVHVYSCGNDVDPNPEIGPWVTPPGSNQTSNGVGKVVLSTRWTVEDVVAEKCAQGPWFDIGNEPAVIRRIHGIDIPGSVVFVEANYGDSGYGPWQVEDITWIRSADKVRTQTPSSYPSPAGVLVTMTPDVHVKRAKGDGGELNTVGFIEKNHPQLEAGRDATRMGIAGERVEDCDLTSGGFGGSTTNTQVRRGDPVFAGNRYSADARMKWKGQTLSLSQWMALGHS